MNYEVGEATKLEVGGDYMLKSGVMTITGIWIDAGELVRVTHKFIHSKDKIKVRRHGDTEDYIFRAKHLDLTTLTMIEDLVKL